MRIFAAALVMVWTCAWIAHGLNSPQYPTLLACGKFGLGMWAMLTVAAPPTRTKARSP